ncbi:leptin receptor [Sardina pilchardus]|uniref:leptin receptor n=1 Tax=Sardina pilchardus TaxID=27697 RepID=UPI002E0EBAA4
MLTLFISWVFIVHGVASLDLPGVHAEPYEDVPWRTELCCEQLAAAQSVGNGSTDSSGSHSGGSALTTDTLKCHQDNSTDTTRGSTVVCLNIMCWLDEEKENLICIRKLQSTSVDRLVTISLRQWLAGADTGEYREQCEQNRCTEDDHTCSVALEGGHANVSLVVNVTDAQGSILSSVMHINTQWLSPPGNLHYTIDLQKEVVLRWSPPQPDSEALRYQVRLFSSKQPDWQILPGVEDSWLALRDLSENTFYIVQVRSQSLQFQEHWSNWSQPLYLCLSATCYMPEVLSASPGSEVTVYCIIQDTRQSATNARWWLNGNEQIPESQSRAISDHVSAVTWRTEAAGMDFLLCCEKGKKDLCSHSYSKVFTKGDYFKDIDCLTTVDSTNKMTCTWSKENWSEDRLMYKWYDGPCEDMLMETELSDSVSQVTECPGGVGQHRKCTLETVRLISCYKLWLEEVGGEGQVKSQPVYVIPIDLVKPPPPSNIQAVSMPNGTMYMAWSRTDLNGFDLEYKVRYTAAAEKSSLQSLGPQVESWAEVMVSEPCVAHKVEVQCKRHNGSGYWSDWSEPHMSTIKDSLAPEQGPEFWRQLKEDSVRNQVTVTLLFKALSVEDPPRCVEGLVVQHQTSEGAVWSRETALGASHAFLLGQDPLTVTVMARNSVGNSSNNHILTLSKGPKRQSVQSFTGRMINSTCVDLTWALLPGGPPPLAFVIEWPHPNGELQQRGQAAENVQWIRVPPTDRAAYVHGHFYGAEQHKFTLYTLYKDGEGKPIQCISSREDPAAYMLLMIIAFLAVVLFVTLISSQNQMKKLMWKDVPDPNKCSWAQGVDLNKVENLESLFRHPDGLTACPLLLISEVVSEAEIVEKTVPAKFQKEMESGGISKETTALMPSDTSLSDSAAAPVSGGTSGILETEAESSGQSAVSGQSSVTYATVLIKDNQPPCQHHKHHQENLSSSSDEGNFSANNSDISGSFTGALWEMEQAVLETGDADPRHSCSYNSVELEFSDNSEEEDEVLTSRRVSSELYYLGMGPRDDDQEEDADGDDEDEEEGPTKLEGPDFGSSREDGILVCVEPASECNSPLTRRDSKTSCSSCASQSGLPLYLPQFRTAAAAKPIRSWPEDKDLPL